MKIRKFEDLESWKKARELTKEVHEATSTGSFARDFWLEGPDSTRINFDIV